MYSVFCYMMASKKVKSGFSFLTLTKRQYCVCPIIKISLGIYQLLFNIKVTLPSISRQYFKTINLSLFLAVNRDVMTMYFECLESSQEPRVSLDCSKINLKVFRTP